MSYGVIEYDANGNPKCEICGKYYRRVLSHVRQVHQVSEKEYKTIFGFDLLKGICSKESSELSRQRVLENFDKCIGKNLLLKGEKTRFVKGSEGRKKDKVSQQTRLMLKKRLEEPKMIEAMSESGRKVGLSGLGNKARWSKNN